MNNGRADGHLSTGRQALATADWAEARAAFTAALQLEETAEGYEGLGIAARYQLDGETAITVHESGYRFARRLGDEESAARLAIQLAYDAYAFRGSAEAAGWAERAAMLVECRPPSVASAYVSYLRGYLALVADHDASAALEAATEAAGLAQLVGVVDVEMLAVALGGLALVAAGRVREGLRKLDAAAAAALGGEMSDADSIETVCCLMIDACKRVRDIERAHEWCVRVRELASRFDDRQMFSVCRTHYADVLLWEGDWVQAERELTAAAEELARLRPGRDQDAVVRLAELRRRQGRTREAAVLLERATGHHFHPLVSGLLALDRGDPDRALEDADRFLRRVGSDGFERVAGLDLRLRAAVGSGAAEVAERAAGEIAEVAARAPNAGLLAGALLAEGRLDAARGKLREAQITLGEAAARFDAAGAPYEAALARPDAAAAGHAAGDLFQAAEGRRVAREALRVLGAALPEERNDLLSPREAEVVRLIARGLSNEDIAHTLVLSVRTVERHVANLYRKIGASGRTARATTTAWAHRHGIT